MARAMAPEERRSFLMRRTPTTILATVRPDGRPHAVPVGVVPDGDDILFLTGERTVKGANLQHDPRLSLHVDDETPPFAFVKIDGRDCSFACSRHTSLRSTASANIETMPCPDGKWRKSP